MDRDFTKPHLAAELLELGEMLFDTMIEVAARKPGDGNEMDASLIEEMRMAADEYFMALRLLLGNKQSVQNMTPDNN